MAHLILENDIVTSTQGTEWHGMAKVKKEIVTFEDTGTDVELVELPIAAIEKSDQLVLPVTSHKAIFGQRQDSGLFPISIVSDSYGIVPNKRIFEMIEKSLEGVNYHITTAGTLDNCKKVFYCIQFDGHQKYMVNGDEFQEYWVLRSSHDRTDKLEGYDTGTRVVCGNTLQASELTSGNLSFSTRHSKNVMGRIENMEKIISDLIIKRESFYEKLEKMDSMKITENDAKYILAAFNAGGDKLSTNALNKTMTQTSLFLNGKGNKGRSRYDLLNGVTEYFTHYSHSDTKKQMASSEFGGGAKKKSEFADLLMDDKKLNDMADKGEKLLLEYI